MQLNFSLKKAWVDLFDEKTSKSIGVICTLFITIELIDLYFKGRILGYIGFWFFAACMIFLANNIINDTNILSINIFNWIKEYKKLISVASKYFCINIIPLIIGIFTIAILFGITKLFELVDIAFGIVIFSPFLLVLSLISLLFAETLSFKSAFNFSKAFRSFTYAWKEYIISCLFYDFCLMSMAIILMIVALFIGGFIGLVFNLSHTILTPSIQESIGVFGGIIGVIVLRFMFILITYFYVHIIAQIYKYSLSKIKEAS